MKIQASQRSSLRVLVVLSLFLGAGAAAAQESNPTGQATAPRQDAMGSSYYLCVFATEPIPRRPRFAHSFAVFVKSDGRAFEAHTISWFPASNTVRLLRRTGETGVNLTLQRTLENARSLEARIYTPGAYQIKQELYEKALRQIEKLNGGRVLYKALDGGERPDKAINCIHAISDIDTDRGLMLSDTNYGRDASVLIMEHLSRWIINRDKQQPWVIEKLGLGKDAILQK